MYLHTRTYVCKLKNSEEAFSFIVDCKVSTDHRAKKKKKTKLKMRFT